MDPLSVFHFPILQTTPEYGLSVIITAFEIFLQNIHWVLFGTLVGMVIGIIPGMGGITALVLLLPFSLGMDPFQAFAFLTGSVGATTFTGSITAILVSTPGSPSNAATLIEGYPLTQKGESERAISASAFSSATGAAIGVTIFIIFIPLLLQIALLVRPPEIFWLIAFAILTVPLIAGERPLLGISVTFLGGALALIGRSPQTAEPRMTFGSLFLYNGLELVAIVVGLFAYAEIMRLVSLDQDTVVDLGKRERGQALRNAITGVKDCIKHRWLLVRSSLIGVFIGAIPGPGGSAATFIAYIHAIQSADDRTGFGHGRIEGVIASEAANDSKDGGQLIPTLGLGIPGTGVMAVFLGALMVHGITPSPLLMINNLELVLVIAFSMLASNFLTSIIGMIFLKPITKLLTVPLSVLVPLLITLTTTSVFIVRNNLFDVGIAVAAGVFGIVLIYMNVSRIGFIVAFVLMGLLERNYFLAVAFAGGDVTDALFSNPLSQVLIVLLLASIGFYAYRNLASQTQPT